MYDVGKKTREGNNGVLTRILAAFPQLDMQYDSSAQRHAAWMEKQLDEVAVYHEPDSEA